MSKLGPRFSEKEKVAILKEGEKAGVKISDAQQNVSMAWAVVLFATAAHQIETAEFSLCVQGAERSADPRGY
jgi:hypothetical protein